jgi:hypothetical protein
MRLLSSLLTACGLALLTFPFTTPGASAQDIFVTPIPGAPFSAVVSVERSDVRHDGSIIRLKTVREIARDTRGRIHNESRILVPASSTETPKLVRIHLYDPESRVSTYLNPQQRTFWTQTVNHPPSATPPALRYGSPTGEGPHNEFAKEEDLGIHEIDGVPAHGIRETQTVHAENIGEDPEKEIVIVDEYWYSGDLRINLMMKHSDPRTGTVTMTVGQIARTDPDPSLFDIPEGYQPEKPGAGPKQ